jgi:hypothetical protein
MQAQWIILPVTETYMLHLEYLLPVNGSRERLLAIAIKFPRDSLAFPSFSIRYFFLIVGHAIIRTLNHRKI